MCSILYQNAQQKLTDFFFPIAVRAKDDKNLNTFINFFLHMY
jgi:hypothetical protein